MNIIIMGPQGAGKTTQAQLLSEKLHLPHIQTGEIYRALAKEDSPLGKKIKAVLERGDLVDDQTTSEVIDKHLAKITAGFILDGFPRTLAQAQRELFPVDKVIYINLSDEEAAKRLLLRKRQDDSPEIIAQRLKLFHSETEPILQHYRKSGKLIEIPGDNLIPEINNLILSKI